MIWYEEDFDKDGTAVKMVAVYNPPAEISPPSSIIEVKLLIGGGSERTLLALNPSMRTSEEPTPEQVYTKYASRISKLSRYVRENGIEELRNPIKYT